MPTLLFDRISNSIQKYEDAIEWVDRVLMLNGEEINKKIK